MNMLNRSRKSGFTIIELMIVLVIVAILLAIAWPSYMKYVRKANRGEAQQLLMNWAVNQEIWRSNNTSYNGTDALKPDDDDKYAFTVAAGTNTYTLTATPQGTQANDESRTGIPCNPLTLNQSGQKLPPDCWE